MKSAPFVILFFLVVSTSACVSGQTVSSQANSSAQASAKRAGPPQSLSQAESFELVNSLNEARKLFPESFPFVVLRVKVVKPENCFGVRLADGRRLVGESSGTTYGFGGFSLGPEGGPERPFVAIGFLYSEFPFSIDRHRLPSGPHIVYAFKEGLQLVGDDEKQKRYDLKLGKDVPIQMDEKLPLNTALPDGVLAEKPTEFVRFSLTVEKSSIVLSLQGNSWKLVPR